MIYFTPQMRIILAVEPVDFRKGVDGLNRICRDILKEDPFKGCVFVFISRKKTMIRLLMYDGQGFWLCHKRLSEGRFKYWPQDKQYQSCHLAVHEIQMLIWNGDPQVKVAPLWKPLT